MSKQCSKEKGSVDLIEARKYLVNLVSKAGEILRKYFESGAFTSRQKEGVDFTTQADTQTDQFLRDNLCKKYPQTKFLTEETAPKNYSDLKDVNALWVIDPLDGTINFSRKHPNFAISVALVDKGISKLAVVYVPMTKETYWTQENLEGAYLNDKKIHVSPTNDLKKASIGCDWAWGLENRKNVVKWLDKISQDVRQIKSMGSAVADLVSLANGQIDGYMHSGVKPWDVAASTLLIEKAGGKITTPTGARWDVFNPDILATNGILHFP